MIFTDQQLPVDPTSRQAFSRLAGELDSDAVYRLVMTVATSLAQGLEQTPVTVSIAGAQGSGKSTMAGLLAKTLNNIFGITVATLSLDDFYLTRHERERLATDIHPLLRTRGVPGTHDIGMMLAVKNQLLAGESVQMPVFDKSRDDRATRTVLSGPCQVLLCEGWCWGAVPEPVTRLERPVNDLERREDIDGAWRTWVNEQLGIYQPVFSADAQIFFAVPSMKVVLDWRWQQEQELIASRPDGNRVMTRDEIASFIAYYERITRWMLEERPGRVDMLVQLKEDHSIGDCRIRD